VVGALIRHGYLRGYDDSSPQRRAVRARRLYCSNRQARRGCGRTLSVWCADKIRRLSQTNWALGARRTAPLVRGVDCHPDDSGAHGNCPRPGEATTGPGQMEPKNEDSRAAAPLFCLRHYHWGDRQLRAEPNEKF